MSCQGENRDLEITGRGRPHIKAAGRCREEVNQCCYTDTLCEVGVKENGGRSSFMHMDPKVTVEIQIECCTPSDTQK